MKKQGSGGDEILKDLFTRMEVIEPSEGFTERVMNRVVMEKSVSFQTEKPLISTTSWIILSVLFAGLIAVIIFTGQGLPGYISKYVNLDYSFNLDIVDKFVDLLNTTLTVSTSTVYYVFLGIFLTSFLFIANHILSNFRSIGRS
jgi:hypothetical protein